MCMFPRLVTETDVVLYCDFHGHSRKSNVFMYGCNTRGDASMKLHERVFPLMMSKNASSKVNSLFFLSLFQKCLKKLYICTLACKPPSVLDNKLFQQSPGCYTHHHSFQNFMFTAEVPSIPWHSFMHFQHFNYNMYITVFLSSPLRVVSSGCRRAKREQDESPCGDLESKTATLWRPPLEAPLWVSLNLSNVCLCVNA